MHFVFNDDQLTLSGVLDQILGSGAGGFRVAEGWSRFDYGHELDARLEEAGFFEVAGEASLGAVMAAEMVLRIAALPVVVEASASALLRPLIGIDLPRPITVIHGPTDRPCRFAPIARSVLWLGDDGVQAGVPGAGSVPDVTVGQPVNSLFAFPMGQVETSRIAWTPLAVEPATLRARWQVGIAAELAGAMTGGLDVVLQHVRDRRQFGQPLGSFQGVQHRLASASVRVEAARLLVLKAAATGDPCDAVMALSQAQATARDVVYDLHQFMGAMGLTLEHPLHRFTYRIRYLAAAFGGATRGLADYADHRWGVPHGEGSARP